MTTEDVEKKLSELIPGCKVEHQADQPDNDVVVFRIETPFFNFKIEQQIAIFAYYKEEDNLIQLSDRGLYSFCVEDRTPLSIRRHRNFIRSTGQILLGSETEEGSFVVNSTTVSLDDKDVDFNMFVGYYMSLLLYCGEV